MEEEAVTVTDHLKNFVVFQYSGFYRSLRHFLTELMNIYTNNPRCDLYVNRQKYFFINKIILKLSLFCKFVKVNSLNKVSKTKIPRNLR